MSLAARVDSWGKVTPGLEVQVSYQRMPLQVKPYWTIARPERPSQTPLGYQGWSSILVKNCSHRRQCSTTHGVRIWSGNATHASLTALHLLMFDTTTQEVVAEYLGTEDLGYIPGMSPGVAMLMECQMERNCGRSSFSALRNCVMTDVVFCR